MGLDFLLNLLEQQNGHKKNKNGMVHYKSTGKRSQDSYNNVIIITMTAMISTTKPLLHIGKIMTSILDKKKEEEEDGITATENKIIIEKVR